MRGAGIRPGLAGGAGASRPPRRGLGRIAVRDRVRRPGRCALYARGGCELVEAARRVPSRRWHSVVGIEAQTVGRHRGLRAVRVRAGRGAGRRLRPAGRAAGSSREMMERALGGRDGAVARCRRWRAPAPGVQACRPRSSASGPLPAPIAPTRSKPIHRRTVVRDPDPGVASALWSDTFPRSV